MIWIFAIGYIIIALLIAGLWVGFSRAADFESAIIGLFWPFCLIIGVLCAIFFLGKKIGRKIDKIV